MNAQLRELLQEARDCLNRYGCLQVYPLLGERIDAALATVPMQEASPKEAGDGAMYGDLEASLRRRITDDGMHGSFPDDHCTKAADAIANLRTALASQIEITNNERALAEHLAARLAAPSKEAGPFGHYFRDMEGREHFHTGATPPSFAQSEITPLYAANPPGDQRQEGESRFFIDHGLVHDRKTGRHLRGTGEYGDSTAEELLAVLQELERAAHKPMRLHFTREAMREAIKADPDDAELDAASPPPEAAAAVDPVQWLRDNYDAHPNIATLCDAMQTALAARDGGA